MLEPDSTARHQRGAADIDWPDETEAHTLLNTVIWSIGSVQYLIDPRSFSDGLSALYEEDVPTNSAIGLKHIQILMVFALGDLLQGSMRGRSSLPGARYFLDAVSCLPSLCTLRKAGTLAVEIMGLFAFYLQCADRKDDAYVYVSKQTDNKLFMS
jgi:proline utilization trans-activator